MTLIKINIQHVREQHDILSTVEVESEHVEHKHEALSWPTAETCLVSEHCVTAINTTGINLCMSDPRLQALEAL